MVVMLLLEDLVISKFIHVPNLATETDSALMELRGFLALL
jgi:hypothetical protein